jgi:hypothetical protein
VGQGELRGGEGQWFGTTLELASLAAKLIDIGALR